MCSLSLSWVGLQRAIFRWWVWSGDWSEGGMAILYWFGMGYIGLGLKMGGAISSLFDVEGL